MTQSSSIIQEAADHGILLRSVVKRVSRVGIRMLAAVALLGGSVAVAGIADSAPAFAADTTCDGVTVVVDFTDIGGELEVGCAEGAQESGRAALLDAGFTATDSQPGLLCAINSMPDPCPETFEGVYWAYWHSTPSSEWESYMVGADSSTPATGSIEGWRYNDGSTPPGVEPADAASQLPAPAPESTEPSEDAGPSSDEAVTSNPLADQQADQNTVLAIVTVSFLALIAAVILIFVVQKRRNNSRNAGTHDSGSTD